MKILFWSDSYAPYRGGLERITETLARSFAARGHEVNVITSHFHLRPPDVERCGDVTVYRFPFYDALSANNSQAIAALLREVIALKRSLRPDIVHLQLHAASSLFHLQTAPACRCPTVATVHGEFGDCKAGPGTLLGAVFEGADWVSAVSQAMLDDLHAIAPGTRTKSSLIYNAVDLVPAAKTHSDAEPPVVLACGRLVAEKGFDLLLEAFHRLLRTMPAVRLVIAGDGLERDRLERSAQQLGLAAAVRFTGPIPDEEMHREMAAATIMAVPSRWREGFGIVALEAAAHGLPVVATTVGGLPEVIEHGRTGLLVPPEDPDALAGAMLELLQSPQLRRQMGEAARKTAQDRFHLESIIDQYETMYWQALMMSR